MEVKSFSFCALVFLTLVLGRGNHSASPLAATLAQAITLLGCLTPQNRAQLRLSSSIDSIAEHSYNDTHDELSDFKSIPAPFLFCMVTNSFYILAYRPIFGADLSLSAQYEVLQFASAQLPQSTQARIQKVCVSRLQTITSKLISDCQDITTSKVIKGLKLCN
jgi:hypothetical protein